jgi:predicted transcriptional regulator
MVIYVLQDITGLMSQPIANEVFVAASDRKKYSLRRSQLEIQMDILQVVNQGSFLPTQIMYKANLAWVALQESLGSLLKNGLLDRMTDGSRRSYQLTSKGVHVLLNYKLVLDALKGTAGAGVPDF